MNNKEINLMNASINYLPLRQLKRNDAQMSDEFEDEDFEDLEIEEEDISVETPIQPKTPEKKEPIGDRVTLFIRSTIGPSEKLEKLTVDPNISIQELAKTVGQIFGLDSQEFHLSISGRTLDPDDILSNYQLEDGVECLIIPISTAGSTSFIER
jgi:hypothetical protein